jgi:excisionase family DNA binding protein
MDTQLLTLEQVAEYLGVHRDTVYKLVRSGRLPALQLGGRKAGWRVTEQDLKDFVDAAKAAAQGNKSEIELAAFDELQHDAWQKFREGQEQDRRDFISHQGDRDQ